MQLGLDRVAYLQRQIEAGEKAEIDQVDNRRIVVSRQALGKIRQLRGKFAQLSIARLMPS